MADKKDPFKHSNLKTVFSNLSEKEKKSILDELNTYFNHEYQTALKNKKKPLPMGKLEAHIYKIVGGHCCYCDAWACGSCGCGGTACYASNSGCPCCSNPNPPPGVCCG